MPRLGDEAIFEIAKELFVGAHSGPGCITDTEATAMHSMYQAETFVYLWNKRYAEPIELKKELVETR